MRVLQWVQEKINKQQINVSLLVFLLLFLNVKLWVKVVALIVICIFNRKNFGASIFKVNKLLFFYGSMILITFLNILLQIGHLSLPYLVASFVGIMFWVLAALASFLCFVYVEKNEPAKIHATISVFFMLNVLVTFATLGKIMIETGALNPYTYQGMYQKYFIMTGDYLRGISFDTSTTNSLLHAFGVVYFINRQKGFPALLCMAGLLLTASNFTSVLLALTLVYVFIFKSNRDQKSLILIYFFFLLIFSIKISPQNNSYVQSTFQKILSKNDSKAPVALTHQVEVTNMPDSLLNPEEKKRKFARLYLDSLERLRREREATAGIAAASSAGNDHPPVQAVTIPEKPALPKDDIHSIPFQRNKEATPLQKELIAFVKQEAKESEKVSVITRSEWKLPGKLIALKQTMVFFKDHPLKLLTGNGTGNFSSKLAFRTTGLNIAGGYPSRFVHIHPDFRDNHLAIFLNYFSRDAGLHSVIHSPNSVYHQLLGEYGIAGVIAFLLLYAGFFIKRQKKLTYGIPLLFLMMGAFFVEYWFEQLSIVCMFELMIFLNIRENSKDPVS